jgi:hypothetical protein
MGCGAASRESQKSLQFPFHQRRPGPGQSSASVLEDVGQLAQVEVAAGQDADDSFPPELLAELKGGRGRGGPRAFGQVVRDPHTTPLSMRKPELSNQSVS